MEGPIQTRNIGLFSKIELHVHTLREPQMPPSSYRVDPSFK